jgi:signal transduction histidine kinase
MIRQLRLKFICVNMLIVLILLSIMLGLVMAITRRQMERESIQMMHEIAAGPRSPARPDNRSEDVNLPFIRLTLDKNGDPVSCEGGYYDLSDEETLKELVDAVKNGGDRIGTIDAYHLRYLVREGPDETVMVFTDITGETHALKHLMTSCLLIGLAGLGLFLIVSILLSRWAVRPVEKAWEQQKQFIGDASHEMKTPLTVILTDIELLQSGQCSEEDRQRFLSSIRSMGEQLRGLVEELILLARADRVSRELTKNTVDLSACVSDAILPFEPVFYEKGLSIDSDIEPGIFVSGDEGQLRQVVEILLDNAQKYALPESTATVRLARAGKNALLTVENAGEELSAEDRENIFRRFYRLDQARTMNHSYGLGLAIARQITENHKGKIWAESENGINRFCVQIPADYKKSLEIGKEEKQ